MLFLPLHPTGRKAHTSSSPSGDHDIGGFPRQQWWWWCRRQRRRPPHLHSTKVAELEKAGVEDKVTASDAKEEAPFRP
ncbi:Os12g0275802 [Oryza sativa Japonica Group]|uniref:Os12g0275802 protein n=1 Tax=Oryza sativa subsp. japonica TaxID=39947 RepID=A0A0P0Y978_ORYSJ|nr:Os12g0275802 [Oryza sativa Japonica Group]